MPFRHLSIARKGFLVLMVPLAYQGIVLGVLLQRQKDHNDAQQWVVHTKDVLTAMGELNRSLLVLQSSFQGYALTRSEEFARDGEELLAKVPGQVQVIRELTRDSAEQQENIHRVDGIVQERLAWHQEVSALFRTGKEEEALARIRALEGKRLMDRLRQEIATFLRVENGYYAERLQRLNNSTARQDWFLGGGLAFSVVIGVGTVLLFGQNVSRRVEKLVANTRRLGRGEELLPLLGGTDELSQVDVSFHEMADGLQASRQREHESQETLERRAQDLERVNRDLDHKNQENEMFVYSVSHDLRSPLVNLQGFSRELGLVRNDLRGLLQGEWSEPVRARALDMVDRDVAESIHYIQTAVMRLSSIIDALLRLSRAGRVDYQPELVPTQAVVERIATALRGSLHEKQAELQIQALPPIWADPTSLEQIFANLLANAVNYLDPKRPGRIEVGSCEPLLPESDGMPTVYVRDNGQGIADAYLPKVFAIFQRLHASSAQGEGVGLTLVKRMVERHGGRIWVSSRAGEGTTFYVAMPTPEESPLKVAPRRESTRLQAEPTPAPKP